MLFDYKSLYKTYTDAELAAIVQHPEKYQPEAVTAAAQLAMERGLDTTKNQQEIHLTAITTNTGAEITAARTVFAKLAQWLDEKSNFLLTATNDDVPRLFTPYAGDEEEKSQIFDNLTGRVALAKHIVALKKFSIIMGALAVLDAFLHLFRTLYYIQYFRESIYVTIGSFFDQALLITGIILLYRLKKPGWILVVAIAVYGGLSTIFWSVYFPITFKTVLSFGLRVYALIFLLKEPKRRIYNISTVNLGWTIVVAVALVGIVILQKLGIHF